MKKYYKVVGDDLKSSQTKHWGEYAKTYTVQYKPHTWVFPNVKGSNLMVFDSLTNTINFQNSIPETCKIFECKVVSPRKIGIFSSSYSFIVHLVNTCNKLKKQKKKYSHLIKTKWIPKGTVFCDGVMLLKQVY